MDKGRTHNKYSKKNLKGNKTKSITNLDAVRKNFKKRSKTNSSKSNVYYSFLTIILLICLVQLTFSAILNISKTISYHSKIVQIKKIRNDAEKKNKQLKHDIKEFSTTASLEAIARNNLKMAGEDEVLILINEKDNEPQLPSKKKKKGMFGNGR